jgi:hypothetical protein
VNAGHKTTAHSRSVDPGAPRRPGQDWAGPVRRASGPRRGPDCFGAGRCWSSRVVPQRTHNIMAVRVGFSVGASLAYLRQCAIRRTDLASRHAAAQFLRVFRPVWVAVTFFRDVGFAEGGGFV